MMDRQSVLGRCARSFRHRGWEVATLALGCACLAGRPGTAQEDEPADQLGSLRAEVRMASPSFAPGEAAHVRLSLANPLDVPIEIDADAASAEAGLCLPASVLFGTSDQPALWITYANKAPVAIHDPNPASQPSSAATALRLSPRAILGQDLDLRLLYKELRYTGEYGLEWKPFGGRVSASARFRIEARKSAVIMTDYGKMTFSLLYERSPRNVENFLELARTRFYENSRIHRIVPNFLIQGGSPDGSRSAARPDGKRIPLEVSDTVFDIGTLAMAHKPSDPDSASCQFFITLARSAELDGKYTAIGQAHDQETLRALRALAELPTETDGTPLRPLLIRFVTLIDAGPLTPERLELPPR